MKKMIFGSTIFIGGLVGGLAIFITSFFKPWSYNNIEGLLGFLLGTKSLFLFILFIMMTFIGLFICYKEAYITKE